VCLRCGHTTVSRAELLKQLMPGLIKLFKQEYDRHA
jgi:transcription elongation factor Elf1